ncbi:glycosyltransferase family 4 protein [Mycobacterium sp. ACS4331]|uniref:glycosyltransferase family 4 protein n=1 Tax=Mycobacterium sp. ACS4331 TaxID=1834121 RepID=UPI0007FC8C7B|nr:glycosyltransferase family 4 protein [Mycobacterium sp. ACS4331]OBF16537.1 hypothetical protein A5727_13435 [Mycobacterium sp. ACS4331]
MVEQLSVTVLGINYWPEPFGIAPYTTGLCRGLASRGHRVNVVTGMPHYPEWRVHPDYRGRWTSIETMDGVLLKRVRHSVPATPSNLRRLLMEATFGARAAFSRWRRPDLVICTTPALISTAVQFLRRRAMFRRRPVFCVWVQDLYGVGLSETQNPGSASVKIVRRLEKWIMREADGIVVAHSRFRDQLVEGLQVDPGKITTIKNWTHVHSGGAGRRSTTRARMGWADEEAVILHAGNMGVKQGLENVVRAAQIADRDELNLRFVLIGDGNQRRVLEEFGRQTARLEIRDALSERDFVDALEAADVLLVNERPGVAEMSIPSKLTSYFQSGTPVLAATSARGNTAREIRRSGAGIVVDAGDPACLVAAAVSLAGDVELREEMGSNGIHYAADELDEKTSLDRFDYWLRSLVATQRTRRRRDTGEAQQMSSQAAR